MVTKDFMLEQLNEAYRKIIEKMGNWLESAIVMLPNLLMAILVILIFYFLSRLITRILDKSLRRFSRNEAVNKLIISVFSIGIIISGIFIALGILNLDKTVTSLLAGVGIAGLAIGLAFKDAASNFLAGIYLALKSPINVGDIIEYEEYYGTVVKIGLRATTINTMQGQDVVLPNHLIIENTFTHYTINGIRRIDLPVGISYGDD